MQSNKKRIALFTERIYPFYQGGSEKVMYDYARILAKSYHITVFTSFDEGKAKQELGNVEFMYIYKKVSQSGRSGNHSIIGILSFSIAAFLHRRNIKDFDIVILDTIHYFYPLLLLRFFKRQNGRVVTIFHEAWYKYRKSGSVLLPLSYLMGLSIKRLIRYSDTIISVSDPTAKSLINNYKANKDRVVTIPLGIDYKNIADQHFFKKIFDRRYDLVFVGRFAAIKRIEDIVDAVSILANKGKNLEVGLIGDGPRKLFIQNKIKKLGLNKNFHIFGFLNENEKYATLADSKIFILPSEREGFSLSTLEAMALGCIPIVSKPKFEEIFGVSHFVANGENGMYYNTGNVEELAQCIFDLLSNVKVSESLSLNAVKTAKLYTINEMVNRINNTIDQIK